MIKTEERIENIELDKTDTNIVTRDQIIDRLNFYLSDAPLNTGKDDYFYIRIVGNHLEIDKVQIHYIE